MKKTLRILLIVDSCMAIIFFIGYCIMEILRVIPFSKNSSFYLIWNIFFSGTQVTGAPLVIIFTIYSIRFLIQKLKKN